MNHKSPESNETFGANKPIVYGWRNSIGRCMCLFDEVGTHDLIWVQVDLEGNARCRISMEKPSKSEAKQMRSGIEINAFRMRVNGGRLETA